LAPEARCQQRLFDRFWGFGRIEGMGGLDLRHLSAMAHCVLGRRLTRAAVRNSVKPAVAGRSFRVVVL
jgi:hypothetical protein